MNGGMGSHYLNVLKSMCEIRWIIYSLSISQIIYSNKKHLIPLFIHIVKDFTLDVRERCDRIRAVKNG